MSGSSPNLSAVEARLRAARARAGFFGVVEGSFLDTTERFTRLGLSLNRLGPSADAELFRHFPVAAIAALEGHFKQVVAAIVDGGESYMERGLLLAKERLKATPDVIPMVHKRTVSVGELVADILPFSALSHLEVTLSKLLDDDFKSLVSSAVDPYHARNRYEEAPPLVSDVSKLWRHLHETFERRHILAHETASSYPVSREDAVIAVEGCQSVANATEAVLWSTVWRDVPLTQYEMNIAAHESYRKSRGELAASLRRGLKVASENDGRARFGRAHLAWKKMSMDFSLWGVERFSGGSIRPLLLSSTREVATRNRTEEIDGWINLIDA